MAEEVTPVGPEPPKVAFRAGAQITIDSKKETPRDRSADLEELKVTSLIGQRDVLIKAMVKVFSYLNGGVFLLAAVAWGCGFYYQHDQIVTEKVLMALIAATVAQAGIAFVAITRFLFPSVKDDSGGK